jgi:hypothetical protein
MLPRFMQDHVLAHGKNGTGKITCLLKLRPFAHYQRPRVAALAKARVASEADTSGKKKILIICPAI